MTDCQDQLSWSMPQAAELLLFGLGGAVQLPGLTLITQWGPGESSHLPNPFSPIASKEKLTCTAGVFTAPGGKYASCNCVTAEPESQKELEVMQFLPCPKEGPSVPIAATHRSLSSLSLKTFEAGDYLQK